MEYKKVKIILIRVLLLNWVVALVKVMVGILTGSLAILVAGFHSVFDGFSNILGLVGIKVAQRPPDPEHPYGHRKFEALAALGIAAIIFITSYEFLKDAIKRFLHPSHPEITLLSFLIMGGSLVVDYLVYLYESSWGKKLKSPILIADALHTKTHLFITPSIILGMIVIEIGFPILDPIMAVLAIGLLLKLAWEIVKETSMILCDQALIDTKKIQKIASDIKGVESSHQIRTRGDAHFVFLDMHIVLKPDLSLTKAHRISYNLKEKIMKEIPQIKDVVIHIEPRGKIC